MPRDPRTLEVTAAYHDRLDAVAGQVADVVGRRFLVDPADLQAGFRQAIADAAAVVAIGQTAAVQLSRGLLRVLGDLELQEAVEISAPLEGNVGETADHRALAEGLAATPAKVFLALKKGRPLEEALRFGQFSASRFALTEVMDGARLELERQIQESPQIRGWRWRSRGTCPACMSLDNGAVRSTGQSLKGHPGCRCIQDPVFDVEESVHRETGRERFAAMSEQEQVAAFGEERARLIRSGAIAWSDLVAQEQAHEWRDALVTRPLQELLDRAQA